MKRSAKHVHAAQEELLTPILRNLTAVAVALMSRDGLLRDANQGFMRLIPGETAATALLDVRDAFIHPRFDQFAARAADPGEDTVCQGIFTIGDIKGYVRSLYGNIYALGNDLLLVAEQDVRQLEKHVATLQSLIEELVEARREIARLERQVEHRSRSAKNAIADREALLDFLPRHQLGSSVNDTPAAADRIDKPVELFDGVLLEWTEDMGTGVSMLDAEHRNLISRMYSLVNSSHTGSDSARFSLQFRDLIDATARHFAHEERVMKTIGFPSYQQHKAEHDRLLQEAHDVLAGIGRIYHPTEDCPSLAKFLRHWLADHTRENDKKIRAYITQ